VFVAAVRAFSAPRRATPQRADGLDRAGPGLRDTGGGPGQHGARGRFGIDRVGLADPAAGPPVRPVDLDHPDLCGSQESGQAGAVAAGALDPDRGHGTESLQPGEQPAVASHRGRELGIAQQPAQLIDRRRGMGVEVGIYPASDLDRVDDQSERGVCRDVCHRGDAVLPSTDTGGTHRRSGGQHMDGPLRQAPIRSRSVRAGACTGPKTDQVKVNTNIATVDNWVIRPYTDHPCG